MSFLHCFVGMMGGMPSSIGNGNGPNMYGSGMSFQGQGGYRPPMTRQQYWQRLPVTTPRLKCVISAKFDFKML